MKTPNETLSDAIEFTARVVHSMYRLELAKNEEKLWSDTIFDEFIAGVTPEHAASVLANALGNHRKEKAMSDNAFNLGIFAVNTQILYRDLAQPILKAINEAVLQNDKTL
jgi:hypothetical protein